MNYETCGRYGFLNKTKLWILPILSGGFLATALPALDWSFFVWIALIPFFFFLDKNISRKELILGSALAGFIYISILLWPLTSLNSWWVRDPQLQSFLWQNKELLFKLFMIIFSVYSGSLFFIAFGFLYKKFSRGDIRDVLILPLFWIILEQLRIVLVLGFTWGQLGYLLHDNLLIVQLASIFGVTGLSFLIVSVNTLIYLLIKDIRKTNFSFKNLFLSKFFALLLIIFLASFSFGYFSITKENSSRKITAAVLHSPLSTADSLSLESHNSYLNTLRETLALNPDVVIMPENALPWLQIEEETGLPRGWEILSERESIIKVIFEDLINLSKENPKTAILLGMHTTQKDKNFNSLMALKGGEIKDIYQKRGLLLFFENSPEFLKKSHIKPMNKGNYGKNRVEIGENLKAVVLICSEVIFPWLARDKEADFIVNVSNDSIFDSPLVGKQNHIMAKLRAIENKKYVLRSVKGGISSIIDEHGRVLNEEDTNTFRFLLKKIEI